MLTMRAKGFRAMVVAAAKAGNAGLGRTINDEAVGVGECQLVAVEQIPAAAAGTGPPQVHAR